MNKLKYLFVLLLTAVLIGGCLLQYFYIMGITDTLLCYTEQLSEELYEDDLESAENTLKEFTALWKDHRDRLYSLIDHEKVNEVETEMAALREDLRNRNTSQLYSESARLAQALRTLAQPEELTLSNVF